MLDMQAARAYTEQLGQQRRSAAKSDIKDMRHQQKLQELAENTDPTIKATKQSIVRQLNRLREIYQRQYRKFPWKREYTIMMPYDYLMSTYGQIMDLVNSQSAPQTVKTLVLLFWQGISKIGVRQGLPMEDVAVAVEASIKSGEIDEEAEIIAMQYLDWLKAPPILRVLGKTGTKAWDAVAAKIETQREAAGQRETPAAKTAGL
jgi:hypothetical protein